MFYSVGINVLNTFAITEIYNIYDITAFRIEVRDLSKEF